MCQKQWIMLKQQRLKQRKQSGIRAKHGRYGINTHTLAHPPHTITQLLLLSLPFFFSLSLSLSFILYFWVVTCQGGIIDRIESNMDQSVGFVERAVADTKKAAKYKQEAQRVSG